MTTLTLAPQGGATTPPAQIAPAKPARQNGKLLVRQLRHLSKDARLEEGVEPHLAITTIWIVAGSVFAMLLWAAFATVPEVAHGEGRIEPKGFERAVQHAGGGVIKRIAVRSGERVEKGQLLAILDDPSLDAEITRVRARELTLSLEAERLRAFAEGRAADFSPFAASSKADVDEAASTLDAMRSALADRRQVAERQLEQKEQELTINRTRLESELKAYAQIDELSVRREQLYEKGLLAFSAIAEIRRELAVKTGEIEVLRERIMQAQNAITEFRARLSTIGSNERSKALQELQTVQGDIEAVRATRRKLVTQTRQLRLTAPVSGVVLSVEGVTEGVVLQAGADLMRIVPDEAPLIARIRIEPRDIGRLQLGQDVHIKVSAYDFVRYGSVPGRLTYISAGSFTDIDGRAYFSAEVELDRVYLGAHAGDSPILSGMTVTADIINGERTILEYLLKPIRTALSASLTEN